MLTEKEMQLLDYSHFSALSTLNIFQAPLNIVKLFFVLGPEEWKGHSSTSRNLPPHKLRHNVERKKNSSENEKLRRNNK